MARNVFHIHIKKNDFHYYIGSLSGVFVKFTNEELGVSKGTLDRYDWETYRHYENEHCVIRRGNLFSASELRVLQLPGLL